MAGSYNHVVTNAGNLGSNERVVGMLENGGDVFEGVKEMFGMIWWLSTELVNYGRVGIESIAVENEEDRIKRFNLIKAEVERARQNYTEGLAFSTEIHRVSPDQRRD